ncbi:MAG TPA: hypothetical protein PKY11_05690, partial [Kiritimatiellia bacterium]|nr:hypothetical protein [Kiritimatiellia bacterium]
GQQTEFGRGYSCRDFVGREWLRNDTFPTKKRLEGLRPFQPDNPMGSRFFPDQKKSHDSGVTAPAYSPTHSARCSRSR